MTERVARLSYFFPAHNEEANVARARRGGARDAAGARRDVRDHRRRTTARATRPARSPTSWPRRTPASSGPSITRRTSATARRCCPASGPPATSSSRSPTATASSGSRTSAGSPTRLGRGRSARRRRRLPDQAGGPARPDDLRPRCTGSPTGSGSASRSATSTAPASCSGARPSRGSRVESGGAFFSAELLIKLHAAGRSIVEVGVPHHPRTAGSPTGAKPSVIFRAVRDFWSLRLRLWSNRARALRRGTPVVSEATAA